MINLLRALPDSNWDTPNWQLGTLPIKLRALLFTKYFSISYLINNYTENTPIFSFILTRARWLEHLSMILEITILTNYTTLFLISCLSDPVCLCPHTSIPCSMVSLCLPYARELRWQAKAWRGIIINILLESNQ